MSLREQSEAGSSDKALVYRRQVLQASGASVVAIGLAGCQSTTSDGGGNGNLADDTFTTFTNADPTNSHYNPYNPTQYAGMRDYLYNMLWRYNGRTSEYHPRLGKKLSIDGKTATITLDTAYKWADGKQVNATDLVMQLTLEKHIEMGIWDFITDVKETDKQTVELSLKEEYNPDVFREVVNRYVQVKRGSEYEDWLNKFQNAGDKKQREQVGTDFQTWKYAQESNDPIANGPYTVGQTSSNKFVLDKNDQFPFETNIAHFEFMRSSSDQQTWQRIITNRIDGTGILAVPKSTRKEFPDSMKKISLPAFGCYSPMWQFKSPVWGKRAARQAFTFFLDRKLVDQNINPRQSPLPYITGLTTSQTEKRLDQGFVDNQLTQYGTKSKPEKAAEKMREAGFTKQGKWWVDGNGKPIQLRWVGPKFPGSIGFSKTLEQTLPGFGIKYKPTLLAAPQWISRRKNQDFDLTFNYIGGGPHPYFFLEAVIQSTRSKFGNWPRKTVDLPPVGQPDGQQQSVNIQEVLTSMVEAKDEGTLKQATKQYAWYLNQELPVSPMTEAKYPVNMSYDDWKLPKADADVMGIRSPIHQLLRETEEGSNKTLLQAKTG